MRTSLQSLPQKKVTVGFVKLQQAGVSSHMWLAMLDGSEAAMQRLVAAWPRQSGVYDAVALLGFGEEAEGALPKPKPGEIVLRYGGWSLQELRDKRPDLMHAQEWYDKYPWASEELPSGPYVLRVPVPDGNHKRFDEQEALLLPSEEPVAVVLAATALLSICLSGQRDPLQGGWTRTGQQTDPGCRGALCWHGGRLSVDSSWDDCSDADVWLASAQRTS